MNNINWTVKNIVLAIIVIAGMVGVLWVALGVFGITIPPWIITIFWIVVAVFVCCFAVKLIASMFDSKP